MSSAFKQPAYPTAYFSNEIYVKCPKCQSLGLVKTKSKEVKGALPGLEPASFHCSNCGYNLPDKTKWFGFYKGSVSTPCGNCGSNLFRQFNPTRKPDKFRSITCEVWGTVKDYEVTWTKSFKDGTLDPHFGLELWMQPEIKSNTLWLYNLDHLRYLRDYVQATIREDNQRTKYSLISNLPQWILSAKNRDLIVKKLNNLEKEVSKKIGTL